MKPKPLLIADMFRKNKENPKSMFLFQPETHGLLLTILDTGYFDNRKNDRMLLLPSFVRNQTETFVHRLPELLPTEFDKLSQSAFFYNNPFISLIAVAIVTVSAILSCFDNRSVFQNVSA